MIYHGEGKVGSTEGIFSCLKFPDSAHRRGATTSYCPTAVPAAKPVNLHPASPAIREVIQASNDDEWALEDLQNDPLCPEDISASDHALNVGYQIIRGSTTSSMSRLRSAEDFEQLKETLAGLQQHGQTDFRPADSTSGESDGELPNAARTNKGEKKYGNNPTERMLKDIEKATTHWFLIL
ncbi:hypothetical protein G7K_5735-t1 [Saitoella complicata NRRL Y-17804]|uniref:Uncharacterized protein n=1 Tax=Saitoella complicata (strain BCRC 22490 / CBS 7301 / JCM 7358 / NBRC 10748 / NRRL Y-17804) TaxID=698492 RepID=A0A0E9NQD5_SAICN|nr:hypothetical protein G7K_5735-t1 [Saitoella complicata NRRL Y-17804]